MKLTHATEHREG